MAFKKILKELLISDLGMQDDFEMAVVRPVADVFEGGLPDKPEVVAQRIVETTIKLIPRLIVKRSADGAVNFFRQLKYYQKKSYLLYAAKHVNGDPEFASLEFGQNETPVNMPWR